MTECPHCGQAHPDGTKFCPHTGQVIQISPDTCPFCGSSIKPGARFCMACGNSLSQGSNPQTASVLPTMSESASAPPPLEAAAAVQPEPERQPAAASTPCPVCSLPLKAGAKFCVNCGTRLEPGGAQESPLPLPIPLPPRPVDEDLVSAPVEIESAFQVSEAEEYSPQTSEEDLSDEGEEEYEDEDEQAAKRKKTLLFGGIGVLVLLLVCAGVGFGIYRFVPKLYTLVKDKIPGLSTVEVGSTTSIETTTPVSGTLSAGGTQLPGTPEALVTSTPDLLATSVPQENNPPPSEGAPAPGTPQVLPASPAPPAGAYPGPTVPAAPAAAAPTVDLTALAYPSPSAVSAAVTPDNAASSVTPQAAAGTNQTPSAASSPTAAQAAAAYPSPNVQGSQVVTPAPTQPPAVTGTATFTLPPSPTASSAPQATVTPAKDVASATPPQAGGTASPTAYVAFFPGGTPTAVASPAAAAPNSQQATPTATPQAVSPTPLPTATPAPEALPTAGPTFSPTFSPAPILPSATSTPAPALPPTAIPVKPPPTAIMTRTPVPTLTPRVTNTPMASPTPGRAVVPPSQSPYAGWLVYAFGQDIRREIYLMNPTTGETKQITNNLFQDDSPSFSPDNLEIVFTSYREPDGWELFVFNLETEEERQITAFDGIVRNPIWSPKAGDDRVIFDGVQGPLNQQFTNIWMVEGSGRGLTQVTDSGADLGANWSPDGMKLVYSHAEKDTNGDKRITAADMGNIYILDLLTNESQRITWSSTRNDYGFSWSPDATWIVYNSIRTDSNRDGRLTPEDSRNLFMIRPDGKEDHMVDLGGKSVFWPGWSPDGKVIVVYEPRGSSIGRYWLYDTASGKINILTSIGPYGRPQYSK